MANRRVGGGKLIASERVSCPRGTGNCLFIVAASKPDTGTGRDYKKAGKVVLINITLN